MRAHLQGGDRVCQAIDRSENKRRVVISRAKTELESWLAAAAALSDPAI